MAFLLQKSADDLINAAPETYPGLVNLYDRLLAEFELRFEDKLPELKNFTNGRGAPDFPELIERCFLPHTPITLADGTTKPIAAIRPGDMVLSPDKTGTLVPACVTRTFVNDVAHVLDFHGTGVTPGHVFLCGAGRFKGRHVPLIDILRDDGAVVRQDGSLMRAGTGCAVGSDADRLIQVVAADGTRGWVRAGMRVAGATGEATLAELIAQAGGVICDGGITLPGASAPQPFALAGTLPAPEDDVLRRSGLTLAEIYAADEWETPPQMAAALDFSATPRRRPAPRHRVHNFEVEGTHTYIADGYRVHNTSALDFLSASDWKSLENGFRLDVTMSEDGTKVDGFKLYERGSYQQEVVSVVMTDAVGNTQAVKRETQVHFANKQFRSSYYEVLDAQGKPVPIDNPVNEVANAFETVTAAAVNATAALIGIIPDAPTPVKMIAMVAGFAGSLFGKGGGAGPQGGSAGPQGGSATPQSLSFAPSAASAGSTGGLSWVGGETVRTMLGAIRQAQADGTPVDSLFIGRSMRSAGLTAALDFVVPALFLQGLGTNSDWTAWISSQSGWQELASLIDEAMDGEHQTSTRFAHFVKSYR